jgi:hypothetical protein
MDIPEGCCITVPSFNLIPELDCSGADPATLPGPEQQPPVDSEGAQQENSEPVGKRSPQTVDDIKRIIVDGIVVASGVPIDSARGQAIKDMIEKEAGIAQQNRNHGSDQPI